MECGFQSINALIIGRVHVRHLVAPVSGRGGFVVAARLLQQEHDVLLPQHADVEQERGLQATDHDVRVHQSIVLGPGEHEEQPRDAHDEEHERKHDKVRAQLVMDPSVRVHAADDLGCGHVEERVHDNDECDGREEDADAQLADRLLVLDDRMAFGGARVQEVVRKYSDTRHNGGDGPRIARVPAVLAAIGDAQEDVAGSEKGEISRKVKFCFLTTSYPM